MGRISAWLTRFGRNERAAVALMFGVSVVPFIMAGGLALDYSGHSISRPRCSRRWTPGRLPPRHREA
ncbi:MAG TPA: hypothetical protein VHR67_07890 [Aestuariivirgaceae bacterium]|nr:hypothetical protein [Aestuariivirgaceae bacterium]